MEFMVLRMNEHTRIEDPRKYGFDVVNELRNLLTAGGSAQRDPRRDNFYDLENNGHTFYIHISPINGDVMLLAKWVIGPKEACTPAAHLAA
jgi:hypothetical protein